MSNTQPRPAEEILKIADEVCETWGVYFRFPHDEEVEEALWSAVKRYREARAAGVLEVELLVSYGEIEIEADGYSQDDPRWDEWEEFPVHSASVRAIQNHARRLAEQKGK